MSHHHFEHTAVLVTLPDGVTFFVDSMDAEDWRVGQELCLMAFYLGLAQRCGVATAAEIAALDWAEVPRCLR